MFVTGLFRRISVLVEAQGLWHISTNRNGDWEMRRTQNVLVLRSGML